MIGGAVSKGSVSSVKENNGTVDWSKEFGEITHDDVFEIVKQLAATHDKDSVLKLPETFKTIIQGANLAYQFKKSDTEYESSLCGTHIAESLYTLVVACGKEILYSVLTNFPTEQYLTGLSEDVMVASGTIETLGGSAQTRTLFAPSKEDSDGRARMLVLVKRAELLKKYRNEFDSFSSVSSPKKGSSKKGQQQVESTAVPVTAVGPAAVFEESHEYVLFTRELNEYTMNVELEHLQRYYSEQDAYRESVKIQEDNAYVIKEEKNKRGKIIVLQGVLSAVHGAIFSIKNKLRAAIQPHVDITDKMLLTAVLPCTGERIENSYSKENLSGMFCILMQEYTKPSVIVFQRALSHLVNYTESYDNCMNHRMLTVSNMRAKLNKWKSTNLWRFMTQDMLFTVNYLRALEQSQFKLDCTNFMYKYISEHKNSTLVEPSGSETPMLDALFAYIEEISEPTVVSVAESSEPGGKQNADANGGSGGSGSQFSKKSKQNGTKLLKHLSGGGEKAASASVVAGANRKMIPKGQVFSGDVSRADNWYIVSAKYPDQSLRYSATAVPCALCMSGEGHGEGETRCFVKGSCGSCNKFGHVLRDCRQQKKKVDGGGSANSAGAEESV